MTEDFEFNFEDDSQIPAPAPSQEPTPTPTPTPTVDPQQIAALQRQQQEYQQFMDAMKQGLGLAQPQNQQNQFLEQFLTRPQESIAPIIQQTVQAQLDGYRLEQEYSQKYPHLVDFKENVAKDALAIQQQAYAQGRPLSERDALDQAAKAWDAKLDALLQQRSQQINADDLRKNALPFSVPSQGQPGPQSGQRNFKTLNNSDFAKVSAQMGFPL